MKPQFSPDAYRSRRSAFLDGLENAVAIVAAAPMRVRSRDVHHTYRASSDLIYLTGFGEPETVAVLRSGDVDERYVLFVMARDPKREQWEGRRAGVEGALHDFKADAAYPIEELPERLPGLLEGRDSLYHVLNARPDIDQTIFSAFASLRGTRGKPDRHPHAIIDYRPRLHDQRRLKEPRELELMKRAAEISAEAHLEAMRQLRPGQNEFEIAALLDYAFRRRGAVGPGYETIVGGGANATILHYTANSAPLRDGDLVLIDAGAEYRFYNGDITRTFPIGKRFTPFQRDLYDALLAVQRQAIDKMRPGQSVHDASEWSRRQLTEVMVELGLLQGDPEALYEEKAYERFYMHGLGHYLGLDVHDVGIYFVTEDEALPLEPGVVVTVEPGIYIPADADDLPEEMRGIGIRIEDDVVVTTGDPDVLTAGVPKDPDEIEALRAEAF